MSASKRAFGIALGKYNVEPLNTSAMILSSIKNSRVLLILAFFAFTALTACEDENDTTDDAEENGNQEKVWEPYQVKANTSFDYKFVQKENDDTVSSGNVVIDIGDPVVTISGEIDGQELSYTGESSSDVQENFESAMNFSPHAAMLYEPFWASAFTEQEIEIGNNWSYSAEGKSITFEVTQTDNYAGLEGKVVEIELDDGSGDTQSWTACVNPDVPLALMTRIIDGEEEYYLELTNYEED